MEIEYLANRSGEPHASGFYASSFLQKNGLPTTNRVEPGVSFIIR